MGNTLVTFEQTEKVKITTIKKEGEQQSEERENKQL